VIDRLVSAFAKAETAEQNCVCNVLPNLKQLTPADKLRLATKLEHLAAILRVCANCAADTGIRQVNHCPLFHPPRKN